MCTRNTRKQHTCKETHVYLYHNSCTHTRMSGRSCCLVCMNVCTCVHVYHNVYVQECIYIIHLHIDVAAACTMHVHNVQPQHAQFTYTTYKHMCTYTCTCTTIHTNTCMSGRSCKLSVWMVVRVYMCATNVRLCVCVYVYVYHTCTHSHRHEYTQYT